MNAVPSLPTADSVGAMSTSHVKHFIGACVVCGTVVKQSFDIGAALVVIDCDNCDRIVAVVYTDDFANSGVGLFTDNHHLLHGAVRVDMRGSSTGGQDTTGLGSDDRSTDDTDTIHEHGSGADCTYDRTIERHFTRQHNRRIITTVHRSTTGDRWR